MTTALAYNKQLSPEDAALVFHALGVSGWGPLALTRLKRWQRAHGLVADAKAGPRTLAALRSARGLGGAQQGASVVIIGDSHVEALGPQLTQKLPQAGVRVTGYTTRRGWSTSAYLGRGDLTQLVTHPEHGAGGVPDAVVMSLGGNGRPTSRAAYEGILRRAVDAVRAAGVQKVIWLGPPTSVPSVSDASADAYRRHEQNANWQREILPTLGVTWIDSRPMTRSGHAGDGVHFTLGAGYPAWADQAKQPIAQAAIAGGGGAAPAPSGGGKAGLSKRAGSTTLWVPVVILGVAIAVFVGTLFLSGPRRARSSAPPPPAIRANGGWGY